MDRGRDLNRVLDRAQKVALADVRVREGLEVRRYAALGVSALEDTSTARRWMAETS